MRLKKIRLENFRCYESLTLNLHPRLTVLVGKNGAGKTAILDALAIGLSPVLRYLSSANQRLSGVGLKDTDIRIESWGMRAGKQRWGASDFSQIVVETTSLLKWDVWKGSTNGKVPASKVGESELKKKLEKVSESFKSQNPEIMPVFAYYGAERGYIEIPQRLRATNHNYGHPPSALLDSLDARSDFRGMLQWFDLEESAELRENKGVLPEEYQENISLRSVRKAIEQVLGGDYSNPHFNREHKFVVEANEGPTPLHVSQLSQGYQSMLALAMDFARRLATGNGHLDQVFSSPNENFDSVEKEIFDKIRELNPQWFDGEGHDFSDPEIDAFPLLSPGIMLIDEVDLHLHPGWQQRVLSDLLRAFPLTQFVVTTHSPQVLTTVPSECIRILDNGRVYAAPPGTDGAEPERMLKQVLGIEEVRPAGSKSTKELKEYLSLVDRDQWYSPRALELRKVLDERYQGQEPALIEADLQIENRRWELGE